MLCKKPRDLICWILFCCHCCPQSLRLVRSFYTLILNAPYCTKDTLRASCAISLLIVTGRPDNTPTQPQTQAACSWVLRPKEPSVRRTRPQRQVTASYDSHGRWRGPVEPSAERAAASSRETPRHVGLSQEIDFGFLASQRGLYRALRSPMPLTKIGTQETALAFLSSSLNLDSDSKGEV